MAPVDRMRGITPSQLLTVVKDYFPGSEWSSVDEKNLDIKVLEQGFGNRLFVCGIKDNHGDSPKPDRVLVRFYGGSILPRDSPIRTLDEAGEVLTFYYFGRLGLGPKLLGIFDGGRIEEFIPSRNLTMTEYCEDEEVNEGLARITARYHAADIPVKRTHWNIPTLARECMQKYNAIKPRLPVPVARSDADAQQLAEVDAFDMLAEIAWAEKLVPLIATRVVFGHNDINRSNVILKNESGLEETLDKRLVLVDYEFSGYNHRGADLANHFATRVFDFGSSDLFTGRIYPPEDIRRHFVECYLDECRKLGTFDNWDDSGRDSVDDVVMECEFYGLVFRQLSQSWFWRDTEVFSQMPSVLEHADNPHGGPAAFIRFYQERKIEFLARYPQFQ